MLGTAKSLVIDAPILDVFSVVRGSRIIGDFDCPDHGNLKQKVESHFGLLVELALVGSLVFFYTSSQAVLYQSRGSKSVILFPAL